MASGVHHQYINPLFTRSLPQKYHNYSYFQLRNNTTNCSARLRTTLLKSSTNKNPKTLSQNSIHNSNSDSEESRVENPVPDPGPEPDVPSSPLSSLLEVLKFDGIGWDIVSIALPAALALASDPITSLVDTAFVGHLGSVELAAVGVSVSVVNLISKLFNVPLLNVTTSFVAEEQALIAKDNSPDSQCKILLPSVSTSLLLALGLGIAEAVGLSLGSGFLMNTMGISVVCLNLEKNLSSRMRPSLSDLCFPFCCVLLFAEDIRCKSIWAC